MRFLFCVVFCCSILAGSVGDPSTGNTYEALPASSFRCQPGCKPHRSWGPFEGTIGSDIEIPTDSDIPDGEPRWPPRKPPANFRFCYLYTATLETWGCRKEIFPPVGGICRYLIDGRIIEERLLTMTFRSKAPTCSVKEFRPYFRHPLPDETFESGSELCRFEPSCRQTTAIYVPIWITGNYEILAMSGPAFLSLQDGYIVGKLPDVIKTKHFAVTITATNSIGSVSGSFRLTVEPK